MGIRKQRASDSFNGGRSVSVRCPECGVRLRIPWKGDPQEVTCDCGISFEIAARSSKVTPEEEDDDAEQEARPRKRRKKKSRSAGFGWAERGLGFHYAAGLCYLLSLLVLWAVFMWPFLFVISNPKAIAALFVTAYVIWGIGALVDLPCGLLCLAAGAR